MKKNNLLVVAHPDDETIFFGGLVQVYRRRPWKIICVTDGNADGQGAKRRQDFEQACKSLRAKQWEMWDFPDVYEQRLDMSKLVERLQKEDAAEVFTHGALGEYGHPHHQDVCLATYRAFQGRAIIWSSAYNCFAEKVVRVPRKAFDLKGEILAKTYFSQTHRFARWLPNYNHEGFTRLNIKEVELIHQFLEGAPSPDLTSLREYAWFAPYLEEFRAQIRARPF